MKKVKGDIWDLAETHWLVVPVNAGWRADGTNVMGRGLAKQAAARFPELPLEYGRACRDMKRAGNPNNLYICLNRRLILFPVKPLNAAAPHLSWRQEASIDLIRRSCESLGEWMEAAEWPLVAMPTVGCGNGQLNPKHVLPVLDEFFQDCDNVVLVEYQ